MIICAPIEIFTWFCLCFPPMFFIQLFSAKLEETSDPDKKQMLERMQNSVRAALEPLENGLQKKLSEGEINKYAEVGTLF